MAGILAAGGILHGYVDAMWIAGMAFVLSNSFRLQVQEMKDHNGTLSAYLCGKAPSLMACTNGGDSRFMDAQDEVTKGSLL